MRIGLILIVVATLIAVPALAHGQELFDQQSLKDHGSLSVEQQSTLQTRRDLIVDEASRLLAHEWAGTYALEDGLTSGAQFDWAPVSGFVIWWTTCSHGWRDRINFGRVEFRDGTLRVMSELGSEGGKVYPLTSDLIPVKWGEQHFLVPLDRLIAFCYAARNAGRSNEIAEFLLKQSDREKPRFGLPGVPSQYKKYLVGKPIQGAIIGLKSQPEPWLETFTLNVGRTAGVVPGMKFFALFPRNVFMLVEVLKVQDNNSEAYVITSRFTNNSNRTVKLRVGWKLTSRAPRSAREYYPG